jgi:hypothetical protein
LLGIKKHVGKEKRSKNMSGNQSLWADFGVVEELTEQAAETISGGAESFSIYNATNKSIVYNLDGYWLGLESGQGVAYTTTGDGIITFDDDFRSGFQSKSYNLADGGRYAFAPNNLTADNPYDLDLDKIT